MTPTFREAFGFWLRLGFINFGGPAGQIALMHRELVERRKWVGEDLFLRALNFCTLLPGPEAQQLATYIGWHLHGVWGGIVAGAFFIIPSVFVLMALSWLAVAHADVPLIAGLLYGVQPVVIAIVLEAVIRLGRRVTRHPSLLAIAAAAFIALFALAVPFPLVVIGAGAVGLVLQRWLPGVFAGGGHGVVGEMTPVVRPRTKRLFGLAALFLLLWLAPIGTLIGLRGLGDVVVQEALFFTQAAFVTFGGAYAVLSYVADIAVNHFGWLEPDQMVQGLGLAESTPGPLIMVTQFVGFVGAWRHHGDYDPLLNGILGGLTTTYVTFLPCFFFIFAGAPYVEALAGNRRIQAALTAITAAVVGVILNLAVFFGSRVLLPEGRTLDLFALVLAVLAYLALWRAHSPVYLLVPLGALAGAAWTLLRP